MSTVGYPTQSQFELKPEPYEWNEKHGIVIEAIAAVTMGLMCLVCCVIIMIICSRKNMQPLKKQSGLLMIGSVIGHSLVVINITVMNTYFQMVKSK